MAAKMSSKFVVMSALAVGAIYTSGYFISGAAPIASAEVTGNGANSLGTNSAATSDAAAAAQSTNSSASSANSSGNAAASGSANSSSNTAGNTTGKSGNSAGNTSANATGTSNTSGQNGSSGTNTTQQYLDGVYSGSAANRIGGIAVAVMIQNGKIAQVRIVSCNTHYPESYIDPVLPNYVVAHQTTKIPVVSGATLSTEDFYYAVTQALSSAQNPNYKG